MNRKHAPGTVLSKGCSYCGVGPGVPCVLVLAPALPVLSQPWSHRVREEAGRG